MGLRVFISLTHADHALAVALDELFSTLYEKQVEVHYSTSKESKSGIQAGEDWFKWIVEQVQQCDFALILITPSSIGKPWIPWEAGAVFGAAMASGEEGARKVRPLLFGVPRSKIPSPIRDSKLQAKNGDSEADMVGFLGDIAKNNIDQEQAYEAGKKLGDVVPVYLEAVQQALLNAPLKEPARNSGKRPGHGVERPGQVVEGRWSS